MPEIRTIAGHSWRDVFIFNRLSGANEARELLSRVEAGHDTTLPADFKEAIPEIQGAVPVRPSFPVWSWPDSETAQRITGRLETLEAMLMFCGPQDAPLAMRQQLVELKRTLRRHAPEQNGRGLIPFARDLRQNLLCLDFGDGFEESMPGVVYLDHSATADGAEPFYPVAPTFQEFLTQLRDEPSSQSERLVEAEITGYLD